MDLNEWLLDLEPTEAGYVRQCFKFFKGTNGGIEPEIPAGLSKARADVLKFHCKSLAEKIKRRRKVDELKVINFKASEKFEKEISYEAAELDVNKSIYIRACIEAGRAFVKTHPDMIKFLDSVIPK